MTDNGRRKGEEALLLALASGQTLRDAAALAAISERTASRRVADPVFRQRLAEARSEMVSNALGRITSGMTEAAETLRSLLKAPSDNVRLGAARALLELGTRLRESVEFDERLAALEKDGQ